MSGSFAFNSDYVSSAFVESIEGLGHKIDANVLDKVETLASNHLSRYSKFKCFRL